MDKNKLAVIHILKKELQLSDDEYRKILRNVAGVTTSKDLDEQKFKKLMHFFVRSKYYKINQNGLTIKQKLYIRYLGNELSWTEEHLANFIRKYYKKDDIDNLSKIDASKLIESLKKIIENSSAKT